MKLSRKGKYYLIFSIPIFFILLSYILGAFIPLMNNDSAHHANIALRMIETGDYISLVDRGDDYLDKPHLSFWLAAISFLLFGVNAGAFKLTSLIFSLVSVYSTYKLGLLLWNRRVACLSAIMLVSSYSFFLANNDVRMDAILTGCIIFSTWQLILHIQTSTHRSMILAALGVSVGFATKGAIGIVLPVIAALFYVINGRQWLVLKRPEWMLMAFYVSLFLLPVFFCFYLQFDLHPEKLIRGSTGNSGVLFLLFGQSAQRYSGKGWGTAGVGDPFFYVHTFLWAFLPWSLLTFNVILRNLHQAFQFKLKKGFLSGKHLFIPTTILFFILLLSGSQFKLPHYLNILFPFIALYTSHGLSIMTERRGVILIQRVVLLLVLVLIAWLNVWCFPLVEWLALTVTSIVVVYLLFTSFRWPHQYMLHTLMVAALLFFTLNVNVFPCLLSYQAGNQLADKVKSEGINVSRISYLEGSEVANSFDFHVGRSIPIGKLINIRNNPGQVLYADSAGLERIKQAEIAYRVLARAYNVKVSKINLNILSPAKRRMLKDFHYLIEIQ